MGEKRGTKALELWCRRITEGYSGVHVHNMTTSWKDGLAFCAMIHHFRPDLIDFDSLDKNDVYGNNELAFKTAEQHLGIPALLDAEDMASCSVPDRLSILTYLSQFYQTFSGSSPSRLAMNSRTTVNVDDRITEVSKSSKKEVETRLGMRRDPCAACGLPVFLAEKFMIAHVTYHRTCFRCARCNSQLTLGNYYETEESQYCCETCPDEESSLSATHESYSEAVVQSDLSRDADIENTIIDCKGSLDSDGSTERRILNHSAAKIMDLQDSSIPDLIAQTSQLRLNSISNHILSRKGEEILLDNSLVDLDLSQHRNDSAVKSNTEGTNKITAAISKSVYTKPKGECNLSTDSLKLSFHSKQEAGESVSKNFVKMVDHMHNISSDSKGDVKHKLSVSSFPGMTKDKPSTSVTGTNNAEEALDHTERNGTKNCMSIVQKQLKVFETEGMKNHSEETDNNHRGVRVLESKTYVKEQLAMIEDLKKVIVHPDFLNISSKSYVDASSFTANQINLEKSDSLGVKETSLNQEGQENAENNDLNKNDDYPKDLNPFKSDEEENDFDKCRLTADSPRNPMEEMKPFETREVEKLQVEGIVSPKPGVRCVNNNKPNQPLLMETSAKRRLPAPQVSLNPFWTDEDDSSSDLECTEETLENTPVPKPRLLKYHQETEKSGRMSDLSRCVLHEPNSFLYTGAGTSIGGTYRKKKAAPPPPNIKELCYIKQYKPFDFKSQDDSTEYHDTPSRSASKTRKTKPAPPPPMLIRTPCKTTKSASSNYEKSLIDESYVMTRNSNMWEDNKTNTDEENKNRKSLSRFPFERNSDYKVHPDKSTQGKWKRKKGPAPSLPTPHRRKVKVRSFEDVNMELDEIELQQQGLEKQGVRLEQLIRNKCESGSVNDDTSLGTDVEELLLELFALVNEKNELFRRQAELMLLRRQQRLEEEHIEVEYQIRCLLSKHEAAKTDFDKQTEEVLIQRLVEIVERRNEIVECLEMDRRREMEEDRSILRHMDLFTASYKSAISRNNMDDHHSAKMKKSKTKEKKFKKIFKKDFEKDIDETELKSKCHNKRKWYYLPSITNS